MAMVGVSFTWLFFLLTGLGGSAPPLGVPPLPEDAVLARVAPEECLFYMAWSGTAVPDAKSANQTEQLLAEPEVQQMLAKIDGTIASTIAQSAGRANPAEAKMAADGYQWGKTLLMRPATLFVSKVGITPDGPDIQGGAVVNLGDRADAAKETLEGYQKMLPPPAVEKAEIAGASGYRIKLGRGAPTIAWVAKGKYLLVGIGQGSIEAILERARGKSPDWLTAARKQLPAGRLSTLTYINVKTIIAQFAPMGGPPVQTALDAIGLNNVTSLISATGMDEQGFVSRTFVGIDGKAAGILHLADAKPLSAADLAPIPRDATLAFAGRLDARDALDTVLTLVGKIEPRAKEEFTRDMGQMEQAIGLKISDDILGSLGDVWCLYNAPSEGGFLITGMTGVAQVKDHARLAAALEKLVKIAQGERGGGPRIVKSSFNGRDIYFLEAPDREFPLAPALCLTEKELIVSTFPQGIKSYLARSKQFQSLAEAPQVAELFQGGGPLAVSYCDTRTFADVLYPATAMMTRIATSQLAREGAPVDTSILPSAAAILPHLRPSVGAVRRMAAGLEMESRGTLPVSGGIGPLVPLALFGVRSAAVPMKISSGRAQSANNLKQIALAMLNHEATFRSFPPAYISDKTTGKALLSWRVKILPYIEEEALYRQFHLNEPWDSPHNKALVARMPATYRSPVSRAAPGMTNYLTIRDKQSVFPGKDGITMSDIRDGTSNTLLVVEAADSKAVIWTKPDDLDFDEKNPTAGLVGLWPGGFNAVFCDGHVQFISSRIDAETMQNLVRRNDGKVIDTEKLEGR